MHVSICYVLARICLCVCFGVVVCVGLGCVLVAAIYVCNAVVAFPALRPAIWRRFATRLVLSYMCGYQVQPRDLHAIPVQPAATPAHYKYTEASSIQLPWYLAAAKKAALNTSAVCGVLIEKEWMRW